MCSTSEGRFAWGILLDCEGVFVCASSKANHSPLQIKVIIQLLPPPPEKTISQHAVQRCRLPAAESPVCEIGCSTGSQLTGRVRSPTTLNPLSWSINTSSHKSSRFELLCQLPETLFGERGEINQGMRRDILQGIGCAGQPDRDSGNRRTVPTRGHSSGEIRARSPFAMAGERETPLASYPGSNPPKDPPVAPIRITSCPLE